ncbi:MAG: septum formation initiator family protein [Peptococcaceae bacterium]|nr:septum formation initiator family protein [Peptococcaceae bacterium]
MGAARKQEERVDSFQGAIKQKNGAENSMFSTNSKRAIAKKQNERVLRRKFEKKKPRLTVLRALIIAFILGVLCVAQYGIIQDMGLTINTKQQDLDDINAENEALKQESAALSNRSVVKEKAEKELGMQEAESIIVYTPSTPQQGQADDAQ